MHELKDIIAELNAAQGTVFAAAFIGSRVTCDPAPTDTDLDVLILTNDLEGDAARYGVIGFDFRKGSLLDLEMHQRKFASGRRGELNLILVDEEDLFRRFIAATTVSKRLNILDKPDRIRLFQAVLYGNPCDQIERIDNQLADLKLPAAVAGL